MDSLLTLIGMTRTDLAKLLHVTPVTVSNWKAGRSRPSKYKLEALIKLAEAALGQHQELLTAYKKTCKMQ